MRQSEVFSSTIALILTQSAPFVVRTAPSSSGVEDRDEVRREIRIVNMTTCAILTSSGSRKVMDGFTARTDVSNLTRRCLLLSFGMTLPITLRLHVSSQPLDPDVETGCQLFTCPASETFVMNPRDFGIRHYLPLKLLLVKRASAWAKRRISDRARSSRKVPYSTQGPPSNVLLVHRGASSHSIGVEAARSEGLANRQLCTGAAIP
jgi:hypothetical protein